MSLKCKASKNYITNLCQLPCLTFWDHKMKTPHASHVKITSLPHNEFNQINCESILFPISMIEYLPYFYCLIS